MNETAYTTIMKEADILIQDKAASSLWGTYSVLVGVCANGQGVTEPIKISEIAEALDITPNATRKSLDDIIELGLVVPMDQQRGFEYRIRYELPFVKQRLQELSKVQTEVKSKPQSEPLPEPEPEPEPQPEPQPEHEDDYNEVFELASRIDFQETIEEIMLVVNDRIDQMAVKQADFEFKMEALRRYETLLVYVLNAKNEVF